MRQIICLLITALSLNASARHAFHEDAPGQTEVQVGLLKCYLTAMEKPVSEPLTSHNGFPFPEIFRREFKVPFSMPKVCIETPDLCEGGAVKTGGVDFYQTIEGEKVRAIVTFEDGYATVEVRMQVGAAYGVSDVELPRNNQGANATLQYGAKVYSLICHKDKGR